MLPDVAIPKYEDVYNQLGTVYDPSTKLVNDQLSALPAQQESEQSALDQAKVNAFRDITEGANRRGVLFSGIPIQDQATYTGTKYLPAVAGLKTDYANRKFTLLDQINKIQAARTGEARGTVADAQKTAADTAYKNAQLQLSYARLANSGSGGISPSLQYQMIKDAQAQADKKKSEFKVEQDEGGNYRFKGANNKPLKLAEFVAGTDGDANTVLDLLSNGSAYDKKIYNSIQIQLANKKLEADPQALIAAIAKQDAANYYGLR